MWVHIKSFSPLSGTLVSPPCRIDGEKALQGDGEATLALPRVDASLQVSLQHQPVLLASLKSPVGTPLHHQGVVSPYSDCVTWKADINRGTGDRWQIGHTLWQVGGGEQGSSVDGLRRHFIMKLMRRIKCSLSVT